MWTFLLLAVVMILVFMTFKYRPNRSLSSFTLWISSSRSWMLSVSSVVSSVYLRLLMFQPPILTLMIDSSRLSFLMMVSAHKLNSWIEEVIRCILVVLLCQFWTILYYRMLCRQLPPGQCTMIVSAWSNAVGCLVLSVQSTVCHVQHNQTLCCNRQSTYRCPLGTNFTSTWVIINTFLWNVPNSVFTLSQLTCFYFVSAIIWNKEQGKSCSKSIIICTIIHTFWQLWYARFIWTWWMHFEWCQIICFGWRRLVIYCSMLRLILFGVTHKKSSYSMYGFSLFVCLYSMFQKDEVLCISHRKPGVLLAEIVIGTAVSKKE